jgi:uncharacterized protein YfaS (alpha-2-macroglobulin family)
MDIVKNDKVVVADSSGLEGTFGSRLRDLSIVLQSMAILGQNDRAKPVVDEISAQLSSSNWQSTQSVAYGLMAMSRYLGTSKLGDFTYERSIEGRNERLRAAATIDTRELRDVPVQGGLLRLKNTSDKPLFATVIVKGIPKPNAEVAVQSGLALDVIYRDAKGEPVDMSKLKQGADVMVEISVLNTTSQRIDNIALTHMVPAGYEIHNDRMDGADTAGARQGAQPRANPLFLGSKQETSARLEHLDIRDDRVLRYFGLKAGESITFKSRLTAAYLGRFYLPSVSVEAMYDATKNARTQGQWVEITTAR